MNRVICLNVNNIIGTYLNTRLYKRMKQNWKQRRREIRNYMERIRIGSVADLPNRRYFFDGGWSSGRRILSTHRSGRPGKRISRSRLIHARGDAVGRWKFQSAISIVTRGEARSRRTAKRLSISCKSTTGIAGRGAPRPVRARARIACLLLKCLHRPFACRNAPDIADFSSTAAGNARPFAKIFCLRIPFFFFRRTISSLWKPVFLLFFSFHLEKRRTTSSSNVSSCDLFFVTRESRDDSGIEIEMRTLRKYSGRWKKSLEIHRACRIE